MATLPSDILSSIEELTQQNQSLQKTLDNIQQDSCQLRHNYEDLVETLEDLLADKNDPKDITWSAQAIADKTYIPLKQIKRAMRNGELTSIPIHRRGKGYVRVATPADVHLWLKKQADNHKNFPPKTKTLPMRRKPPNVVF